MAVGLVLSGVGLLMEAFPVSGVDVVCNGLHFGESWRLPLLTHNVLNAFSEPGVVAVPEDTFIPAGADSEMVEFDIIFDNMLIIMHL